jgi:hypothetical protein
MGPVSSHTKFLELRIVAQFRPQPQEHNKVVDLRAGLSRFADDLLSRFNASLFNDNRRLGGGCGGNRTRLTQ